MKLKKQAKKPPKVSHAHDPSPECLVPSTDIHVAHQLTQEVEPPCAVNKQNHSKVHSIACS